MAINSTSVRQKGISNNTISSQFNDYQIVLDSITGTELPRSAIAKLETFENLFTLLPYIMFDVIDSAAYFNTGTIHVGQTVYIQLKPKISFNNERVIPKYIALRTKILSITTTTNISTSATYYHVLCCFDALNLLSTVYPYPQRTLNPAQKAVQESSINAIKAQMNAGGLLVESEIEYTDDAMIWINTRHKICEVINKIVNHSWISEDDAMLVFSTCVNTFTFNEKSTVEEIDKAFSAVATITSCKTLAQKAVEATYISTQNTSHKDICFRYDRIFTNSKAGLSTLRNAYKQVEYLYTPLNVHDTKLSNLLEFQLADSLSDTVMYNAKFNSSIRKVEYNNEEVHMSSNSGKIDSLYEGINVLTAAGMHFNDTHAHYDVAPAHNSAIISSFFNTSVVLQLNLSTQAPEVFNSNTLPRAGQKILLDSATHDKFASVDYSGEFIVAQVHYLIADNNELLCELTLMSDGTYFVPHK